VLDDPARFHTPKFRRELRAPCSGFVSRMDCEQVGWAVQRLGAGREKAGEPVAAHAGLEMMVKLGDEVQAGQPLCMMFADEKARFTEASHLLVGAIHLADWAPEVPPLISEIVTGGEDSAQNSFPSPRARTVG
jgi:pyrimidine-nucleoside phosphorylase